MGVPKAVEGALVDTNRNGQLFQATGQLFEATGMSEPRGPQPGRQVPAE